MYAEDIDLCFKLKSAGKQNYYLGNVSVVHHGGQSSNASSESQFGNVMMRESIAKFLRLHRGARYALAYRVALAFTALARLGALGLTRLLGLGSIQAARRSTAGFANGTACFDGPLAPKRGCTTSGQVLCRQCTRTSKSNHEGWPCGVGEISAWNFGPCAAQVWGFDAARTGIRANATRRVLILGATFGTDNMGVGALASGAISILSKCYPDAEICFLDYGRQPTVSTVYVDGKEVQVPLVNLRFSWKVFLRNNVVYLLALSGLIRLLGERFSRRMTQKNQWIKTIRDADLAVAVSGGDSFSDIYGLGRFFYVYLPQLLVVSLGTKLVLLPQTIGPFRTGLARRLAEQLMGRAQRVYSRDWAGVRDAQDMLGSERERARFCYDLGFILEPRRPQTARRSGRSRLAEARRARAGRAQYKRTAAHGRL